MTKENEEAFQKLQEKNQELFNKVKELEIELELQRQEYDRKVDDVSKLTTESEFFEKRLEEQNMQLQVSQNEGMIKDQMIGEERNKGQMLLQEQKDKALKEQEELQAQINISNLEKNTLKDEKHKLEENIDELK